MSPRTDRALLGAALLLGLSACEDYLARRDTIAVGAGDAVAANRAVHAIDPWPAHARNTSIPVSGRRVVTAVEAYEVRGTEAEKKAGGSPATLAPVAVTPPGGTTP